MSLFTTGIIQEFLTTHQPGPYNYQIILSGTGPGTFEIPEGVYEITVGCWGAGAAGLGSYSVDVDPSGGGAGGLFGGGGGGYAQSTISVTPGTVYSYNVGAGGSRTFPTASAGLGGSGGTTFFGVNGCNIGTATIRAMGGGGSTGSVPGSTTIYGGGNLIYWANIGTITYLGGNGANGTSIVPYKTGGGGGGAGSLETGHFGSQSAGLGDWASGGTASNALGGAGGLGFYLQNVLGPKNYGDGVAAYNYGGGGGGAGRYAAGQHTTIYGGEGAQGLIVITLTI
jgi:hypothetical protein